MADRSRELRADGRLGAILLGQGDITEAQLRAIEDEVYAKDPDWATTPYEEAVDGVGTMLREHHPELDDRAVKAFQKAFAFDWK